LGNCSRRAGILALLGSTIIPFRSSILRLCGERRGGKYSEPAMRKSKSRLDDAGADIASKVGVLVEVVVV
jgi:hypothetical protein